MLGPRNEKWDLLSTVSAIDLEIAVEGEDRVFRIQLRQSDKAGVSQRHWNVLKAIQQPENRIDFPLKRKANLEDSSFQEKSNSC